MDAFEQVVTSFLEREGFWVRSSFKVPLTAQDKARIGRKSSPRWEIDLLGYRARRNELHVVECKSYLDSRGVGVRAFDGTDKQFAERFKLFTDRTVREVVLHRMVAQLVAQGTCRPRPRVTLCLAAGHVASVRDRDALHAHFKRHGWVLWDEGWMVEQLRLLARGGYENDTTAVVAKLLIRGADRLNVGRGSRRSPVL